MLPAPSVIAAAQNMSQKVAPIRLDHLGVDEKGEQPAEQSQRDKVIADDDIYRRSALADHLDQLHLAKDAGDDKRRRHVQIARIDALHDFLAGRAHPVADDKRAQDDQDLRVDNSDRTAVQVGAVADVKLSGKIVAARSSGKKQDTRPVAI